MFPKIIKFHDKLQMPKTTKQVKQKTIFKQFFRKYINNSVQKLMTSYYKLQMKDALIVTTNEHVKALEVVTKDRMEAKNVTC